MMNKKEAAQLLEEAVIVDSVPSDVNESNHKQEEQPAKKTRKPRQPKDKYAKLQSRLEQFMAVPAFALTMRGNLKDAEIISNHSESLPQKIVDVARQYDWFFKIIDKITSGITQGGAIGALLFEVVVIGLEIGSNHGINLNIPGLSNAA